MPSALPLRFVAICSMIVLSAPLSAQQAGPLKISVQSISGLPVVGAQVRVGASENAAESDEAGQAVLSAAAPGPVWVRVRRIGYRPDSIQVTALNGKTAEATIRLDRAVVELTPITVLGRRSVQGPMAGFYARQATGSGRFFTRSEIERRDPHRMSDLLRGIPGVRIESRQFRNELRIRGSRCNPLVWLDGQPLLAADLDLDSLDPLTFEGVEVYSTSSVPVEFLGSLRGSSSCGTILLWSRQGASSGPRESKAKRTGPSAASVIVRLLDELKIYAANDVDSVARVDSLVIVHPEYPDSLYEAQAPGRVLAEFVVNTNGLALIETFNAVTTTHRSLVEPVRRAVREQHFFPAFRGGKPVQQVMQLHFDFKPDSLGRRKR